MSKLDRNERRGRKGVPITIRDKVRGKKCTRCGRWMPMHFFYPSKRFPERKRSWCVDCEANYHRNRAARKRTEKAIEDAMEILVGEYGMSVVSWNMEEHYT